jgi:hypothetical protein
MISILFFYDKNQRLQHNQLNIIRGFLENFKEDFGNTVLRPQIKWVELKGHRNHPRGKVIQSDYPWKTVSI